jgi:DNA invertase Pin-like site-specific DNA recombinase
MRAAIYARCSTTDQTVDLQLDGLREYAQARGFDIVDKYIDEGVSGARANRPALDRLLEAAHRRRFDAVLIWKLDRLGRSLSHLIRLVETFSGLGIDLISLSDPGLDTTSPQGKLLFSVMGAVAEFERDLIRERTRAGMASARRRGKLIGRPRVHVPVGQVQSLLAQGMSQSAAARRLGVSRATLQRVLKRVPSDDVVSP